MSHLAPPRARRVAVVLCWLLVVAAATARPAAALGDVAESQARDIRNFLAAVQRAGERARALQADVDRVVRNLARPAAQAGGSLPGWTRRLDELRGEAARLREVRTGLRTESLETERADPEAASILRRFADADRRLQGVAEAIERAARSLQDLQRLMQAEATPPPQTGASRSSATKAGRPAPSDLSGIWTPLAKGPEHSAQEWRITHNVPAGTITISRPTKHLPGVSVDFMGAVKGDAILARHRVSNPAILNPKVPERVRREHTAQEPVWQLTLRVDKDGRLVGSEQNWKLSWDKKEKLLRATAQRHAVVLARKEGEKQAEGTPPVAKGPPDPEPAEGAPPSREDLELLRRDATMKSDIAAESVRRAREASRARGDAERRLEEAQARVRVTEQRLREAEAAIDRDLIRELRERERLRRPFEDQLRRRFEKESDRLFGIIRERRSATGASEEAVKSEMRRAGEFDELDRLYEELQRSLRKDYREDARIRELLQPAAVARFHLNDARTALEETTTRVAQAEGDEFLLWETYDKAQRLATRAREAWKRAMLRARAAGRASP